VSATGSVRTGARQAARAALRRLPPPAAERLKAVRAAARPGPPVVADPSPDIPLPPDVADGDALRARLAETDLFGEARAEAEGYLADAFDRFRITMALLPELPPGAKVLELGSNPYFLTRLLRERGLDVTSANYFGPDSGFGDQGEQVVTESGTVHTYRFDHFNIEADRYPYDDGSFDLVMFCEILEHLPADPIHALCEINRVLRPGGTVIITTPNASRLSNLLRITTGENVYEELSGYGTYGRHNREYTVAELRQLLEEVGFDVERVLAADIGHAPDPASLPPGASPVDRGENLFAVARGTGRPRWRYSRWLYSSAHALKRAVRPDLVVGVNCELQSSGLHALEEDDRGTQRWTGPGPATALIDAGPSGADRVVIEGLAPPPAAGQSLILSVTGPEAAAKGEVVADGQPFRLELPLALPPGEVELTLTTDRTWTPGGPDTRRLGVQLRRVSAA
jgi:SAM-dependent methyltransferase